MKEKLNVNKISMIIVKLFFLYTIIIAFFYYSQRDMMYFPTKEEYNLSEYNLDDFKKFTVITNDNLEISGLYKAPFDDKPIIIFFHGNTGHAGYRENKIRDFVNKGYGVLLAEYRGYGPNQGKPSEKNLYEDARAYLNKLASENIVIYGQSLGTGIAVQMATEYKAKALILETPFDSALNVAKERYFFIAFLNYLMHDKYENDKKISTISIPKLFILAGKDEVVGIKGGKRLADIADDNKKVIIIEDAAHNIADKFDVPNKIISFINDL